MPIPATAMAQRRAQGTARSSVPARAQSSSTIRIFQALRPSRRQGPHPGRRNDRQDQGRARCAPWTKHSSSRATDAVAVEGFERRDRRRARFTRKPAPTSVLRGAEAREDWRALAKRCRRAAEGQHGRRRKTPTFRRPNSKRSAFRCDLPGGIVRALAITLPLLRVAGDQRPTEPFRNQMLDFTDSSHDRHARNDRARASATNASRLPATTTRVQTLKALDPVTLAVLNGRPVQIATKWTRRCFAPAFNPIIAERMTLCTASITSTPARPWCRAVRAADLRRRNGVRREGCDR